MKRKHSRKTSTNQSPPRIHGSHVSFRSSSSSTPSSGSITNMASGAGSSSTVLAPNLHLELVGNPYTTPTSHNPTSNSTLGPSPSYPVGDPYTYNSAFFSSSGNPVSASTSTSLFAASSALDERDDEGSLTDSPMRGRPRSHPPSKKDKANTVSIIFSPVFFRSFSEKGTVSNLF